MNRISFKLLSIWTAVWLAVSCFFSFYFYKYVYSVFIVPPLHSFGYPEIPNYKIWIFSIGFSVSIVILIVSLSTLIIKVLRNKQ